MRRTTAYILIIMLILCSSACAANEPVTDKKIISFDDKVITYRKGDSSESEISSDFIKPSESKTESESTSESNTLFTLTDEELATLSAFISERISEIYAANYTTKITFSGAPNDMLSFMTIITSVNCHAGLYGLTADSEGLGYVVTTEELESIIDSVYCENNGISDGTLDLLHKGANGEIVVETFQPELPNVTLKTFFGSSTPVNSLTIAFTSTVADSFVEGSAVLCRDETSPFGFTLYSLSYK